MAGDMSPRRIVWTSFMPGDLPGVNVIPSTREFYQKKAPLVTAGQYYRMEKAAKGRCCIISEPTCQDCRKLGELWSGLGFDVTIPNCQDGSSLTAQEILDTVAEFSKSLTVDDQCAVLCLLNKGESGHISGSDGVVVKMNDLLRPLDEESCPNMAGKPKVVVIQGGAGFDNDEYQPTRPDFIVCSPSLLGGGLLDKFVNVFSRHAAENDIHTLMTLVKSEVPKTMVHDGSANYLQLKRFNSSLTKLLYFFPCRGGRQGKNWEN